MLEGWDGGEVVGSVRVRVVREGYGRGGELYDGGVGEGGGLWMGRGGEDAAVGCQRFFVGSGVADRSLREQEQEQASRGGLGFGGGGSGWGWREGGQGDGLRA